MRLQQMMDRVASLGGFYAPCVGSSPGMVGMEGCESLSSHLNNGRMIAARYLGLYFTIIQKALDKGGVGDGDLAPSAREASGWADQGEERLRRAIGPCKGRLFFPGKTLSRNEVATREFPGE